MEALRRRLLSLFSARPLGRTKPATAHSTEGIQTIPEGFQLGYRSCNKVFRGISDNISRLVQGRHCHIIQPVTNCSQQPNTRIDQPCFTLDDLSSLVMNSVRYIISRFNE
uniref:Uncharacterized protein n=1 Tax=Cacopsylla melanoneura TaxID=428564 RepID=A0A8D8U6L5_9HEMI